MHVSSPFQTSSSAPLATSTNVSTTNKRFGLFRFSSWRGGPWLNDYWRTLYSVRSKSEFSSRVCSRSPPVLLRKSIEHQVKRTPQKVATSCTLNVHCCFAEDMYRTPKYHLTYWTSFIGNEYTNAPAELETIGNRLQIFYCLRLTSGIPKPSR